MSQHTQGPWNVQDNTADEYGQLIVESATNGAVAICYTMEKGETAVPQECLQNARLIAAAPDMHAALLEVCDLLANPDADEFDANKVERRILDILNNI